MIITWYGHACFKAESSNVSVVFDPYLPGYVPGVEMPIVEANYCICSHGHSDHHYTDGVKIINNPSNVDISEINTFHDHSNGAHRGTNTCTVFEFPNGERIAHLGDLGHELSEEQIAKIGKVNVLLIPVGGHYTIDGNEAANVAKCINADITIPMHYKGNGFGYDVISTVDVFANHFNNIVEINDNILDTNTIKDNVIAILKCTK